MMQEKTMGHAAKILSVTLTARPTLVSVPKPEPTTIQAHFEKLIGMLLSLGWNLDYVEIKREMEEAEEDAQQGVLDRTIEQLRLGKKDDATKFVNESLLALLQECGEKGKGRANGLREAFDFDNQLKQRHQRSIQRKSDKKQAAQDRKLAAKRRAFEPMLQRLATLRGRKNAIERTLPADAIPAGFAQKFDEFDKYVESLPDFASAKVTMREIESMIYPLWGMVLDIRNSEEDSKPKSATPAKPQRNPKGSRKERFEARGGDRQKNRNGGAKKNGKKGKKQK